jgi:hypothetical protein
MKSAYCSASAAIVCAYVATPTSLATSRAQKPSRLRAPLRAAQVRHRGKSSSATNGEPRSAEQRVFPADDIRRVTPVVRVERRAGVVLVAICGEDQRKRSDARCARAMRHIAAESTSEVIHVGDAFP